MRICKVFTSGLAKRLLHKGFPIIDIVPNKNDRARTVFVFEDNDDLQKEIEYFKKMIQKNREEKKEEVA